MKRRAAGGKRRPVPDCPDLAAHPGIAESYFDQFWLAMRSAWKDCDSEAGPNESAQRFMFFAFEG